ncbi:MAG: VOC family protein [Hydrogenophaga sp.]|uniref:VOC family protein n=1 Tax=Hydrogenophaga sp. TaxID=1904254 RepID=UPI00271D5178|nr:VOC family protein [Hydrogenophaga sp.]MDO9147737.1 VOC family protein [Hydrogenophaga sp.]MDO9603251.1 VOC family protein [Hydrogenophaga sp.]
MPISKLAHFSVRTTDLVASRRFYSGILGLKEGFRPPFKFPGAWMYLGGDEADHGVVHLIAIDENDPQGLIEYLGDKDASSLNGSAAVDHLAFLATDLQGMLEKLNNAGSEYRQRTVPSLGLHQVFVEDPSGVTIELNFPSEEAAARDAASGAPNASSRDSL